ncbi:hypothetical protein C2S52_010487 [Perilla frutescens var. hirtella]|nr:hypothetical protein C2S52_010487 [Perilla frutescens var. hirtella]
MASCSLLLSTFSSTTAVDNCELAGNSTFLQNPKVLFAGKTRKSVIQRCEFKAPVAQKSQRWVVVRLMGRESVAGKAALVAGIDNEGGSSSPAKVGFLGLQRSGDRDCEIGSEGVISVESGSEQETGGAE